MANISEGLGIRVMKLKWRSVLIYLLPSIFIGYVCVKDLILNYNNYVSTGVFHFDGWFFGTAFFALLSFATFFFYLKIFMGPTPFIKLDSFGIEQVVSSGKYFSIPWREIKEFKLKEMGKQSFISIDVKDLNKLIDAKKVVKTKEGILTKKFYGAPIVLIHFGFIDDVKAFHTLLLRYHEAYGKG